MDGTEPGAQAMTIEQSALHHGQPSVHHAVSGTMISPQEISTTPQREDTPLLLFCPEQGGWHTGVWFRGVWLAYIDTSTRLQPTHWLPMLPDPIAAFGSDDDNR